MIWNAVGDHYENMPQGFRPMHRRPCETCGGRVYKNELGQMYCACNEPD